MIESERRSVCGCLDGQEQRSENASVGDVRLEGSQNCLATCFVASPPVSLPGYLWRANLEDWLTSDEVLLASQSRYRRIWPH